MTVFEEVEVVSRDWTGYDPDLLDRAIARGNDLEDQSVTKRRIKLQNFRSATGGIIIVSISVILLAAMIIFGINRPDRDENIFSYAYKLGQSHAISGSVNYALVQNKDGESVFLEIDQEETPNFYSIGNDWRK